jgi:recombinational DNA repair protein RecR
VDDVVQVTLSPSAEASPHAAEITGLIRRYFTAINRHDYEAWLATVSTAQAKQTELKWIKGYQSTHDSNIYISDINEGDPITVRMQFVSHQSIELAPTGLKAPCVRWDVTYQIVDEGIGLRVGTSAQSPSMAACS